MPDFGRPISSVYIFSRLISVFTSKELFLSVDGFRREFYLFNLSSFRVLEVAVWLGLWPPYFENWSFNNSLRLFLLLSVPSKLSALVGFLFSFYKLMLSSLSETDLFIDASLSLLTKWLSNIFLNHWTNSKLSWYLHLISFSTSIFFMIPNLVKYCWRTLKLLMYS